MLTTDELVERMLHRMDMLEIIEILHISADDLLEHFSYRIEQLGLYDGLNKELGD
jgi:hypothetical protein